MTMVETQAAPSYAAPPTPSAVATLVARSAPATPLHAQPAQPRRVRATAPATGFPLEALLATSGTAPSILDVDPRLLVVRRAAPRPAKPAVRSLAAPVSERRERQSAVRRRILTAVGCAGAAAVSLGSLSLALA